MQRFAIWITALLLSIGGCTPAFAVTPTPTASPTPTVSATPTISPTATPSPTATGYPIMALDGNGFDTLAVRDAVFHNKTGTTGNINMGVLRLGADLDERGTMNIRTGDPAAGKVATSADTIGTLEWTSGTVVVGDALLGPPFTINGGPTLTPMVEVNVTTSTYIAFNSFHNAATDANGALKYSGGAYRGAIGAMSFLNSGDSIYKLEPLVPYNATTWARPSNIRFYAGGAHSAGVYPVNIDLFTNNVLSLGSQGAMQFTAIGAMGLSSNAGIDLNGGTPGVTVTGTLNVTGSATGGATFQQPPNDDPGIIVNASVDDTATGSVALYANSGSSTDATAALTTYNRAGVKKFGIGHNGNFSAEGTGIVVGAFEAQAGVTLNSSSSQHTVVKGILNANTSVELGLLSSDFLTINASAPDAPNLGTVTPASYLGISAGNIIGKFAIPPTPTPDPTATPISANFPHWEKYSISHAALTEAANGVPQTIGIPINPRTSVQFIFVKTTVAFGGGGIVTLTVDPDSTFFPVANPTYDLLAAVGDANFTSSVTATAFKSAGAWGLEFTFTPDAAHNLAGLTTGTMEFDFEAAELP